ncbi:arylesterase [Dawidia soli]|uniref:Arylesterase n=1 Tax=Dawidia soli TaxID=2782352 RepID=A0AAP2GFY1_9BACT|nr:arylesterase [Dawidia soli]MBT1684980.1 arylesterase [Dawidia soli]
MKRIVFFGDSLTAGYGLKDPAAESFPALIRARIEAENLRYEIVNAGISGDTSSGGLGRLEYWISAPVEIFVLALGINDAIRGLPVSSTYLNLNSILRKVRSKHKECKLAVMGMEIPNQLAPGKFDEFRAIFRKLADEHQAALVPFFLEGVAGVSNLNLPDGLHPSKKGYEVIAANVWPVLRNLMSDVDAPV